MAMIGLILVLFILPFVQAPEYPLYAEEGSTYNINCVPTSLSTIGLVDIEYHWMAPDGKPLSNDRYLTVEDGILEITGVMSQDAGELICVMTYGEVENGIARKERFQYSLTVYTLPLMLTYVTINYRINNCQDEYDNNIWKEIFNTALRIEVCRDNLCDIRHFETRCLDIQEEQSSPDDLTHELQFNVTILVSHKRIPPCNVTCMLGKLYDHLQLIMGKLKRYTNTQTGQLANSPSLGFTVVQGSLQTEVHLGCTGGHGLRGDICVACEPGTHSPAEARDCTPCGKGSYGPNYAASKCKKCPRGHHSYKPGATRVKQCHNRETMMFILGSIGIATFIMLLFSAFFIYKFVKKKVIKSHGIKLPGLEMGKGVDLLANMHEVDYEKHERKHKRKKLRFEPNLFVIEEEEHTPLMADDIESPREIAVLGTDAVKDVQRDRTSNDSVLLVINEEGSVGTSISEQVVQSWTAPIDTLKGERNRMRKSKRAQEKKKTRPISSDSSSSSDSSFTFSDSGSGSSFSFSSSGSESRTAHRGRESKRSDRSEASAIYVPDETEEHTAIFPTERMSSAEALAPDAQQSRSIIMLHHSASRDTQDIPIMPERTPSKMSSRQSLTHRHSPSPHNSPTGSLPVSPTASILAGNLSTHDVSVHRTPSVSQSAQLTVRRTMSAAAVLSHRSSLIENRLSSITKLPPSPPTEVESTPQNNNNAAVLQSAQLTARRTLSAEAVLSPRSSLIEKRLSLITRLPPSPPALDLQDLTEETNDHAALLMEDQAAVSENAFLTIALWPSVPEESTAALPNPQSPPSADTPEISNATEANSSPQNNNNDNQEEFLSCASEMETSPPAKGPRPPAGAPPPSSPAPSQPEIE